jgi:hypothetical protein
MLAIYKIVGFLRMAGLEYETKAIEKEEMDKAGKK